MKIRSMALIMFLLAMCSCCSLNSHQHIPSSDSTDWNSLSFDYSNLSEFIPGQNGYNQENSKVVYEALLGDFYDLYEDALDEKDSALRYVKFAKAEANLLDSGIVLPFASENIKYTLSRLVPHTVPSISLYNNQYNFKNLLVTKAFLTNLEEETLNDLWLESIKQETKYNPSEYLSQQNHEIVKQVSLEFDNDFATLNPYIYSNKGNQIALKQCFDSLFEYNNVGDIIPCIADSYKISEDGRTYTISIKDNRYYYTSDGRIYDKIQAEDFVNGIKYYLDYGETIPFLLNSNQYIKGEVDFEEVGIKAIDNTTFEFTLQKAIPGFLSFFTSPYFYPFHQQFYLENSDDFANIGNPASMIYTGAFYPTSTSENQIILKKNPLYPNQENISIDTMTFSINYFQDASTLQKAVDGVYSEIEFEEDSTIYQLVRDNLQFDSFVRNTPMNDTTNFALLNVNRNCFETNKVKTSKSDDELKDTWYAMQNKNFRKALIHSIDRSQCNSFFQGNNLATYNLRNSLTAYEFVRLPYEVTLGETTFVKNTFYGEILEYYFNELGNDFTLKEHLDSFYNPQLANHYLSLAQEDLKEHLKNPISLDVLCLNNNTYSSQAKALKNSIENTLNHNVSVNLLVCKNQFDYFDAYNSGCYDLLLNTFWTPDYQDPSAYLRIFTPEGDKINLIGL